MNRQTNRCHLLFFSALLLLLAACGQDAQPVANTPSTPGFSFNVDPAAGSAELKPLSPELVVAARAECVSGIRVLIPGNELKLADYDFAFLPGNILKITASFTNATTNAFEQPFTFSADSEMTSNIVSSAEPEITNADLGGDSKLSPKETTTVLTFTVEHKGQAFSYGVSATAEVSCEPTDPPEPVVCTDPVTIPDKGLEAAIRDNLGKPTGELTCSDLADLTELKAGGRNISDLGGLQYAVNLVNLFLNSNQLSTLRSGTFAGMTNLQVLGLGNNPLSDIGPLSGLTNLQVLGLDNNRLSDIGPLKGLTSLQDLYLENDYIYLNQNQISDVSPLSGLTNLQVLNLDFNEVSDIGPFKGLTNLQFLGLSSNEVSDISPLESLTNLQSLRLYANQLSDISAVKGLTNLQLLDLSANQVSDISALSGLTKLQLLALYYNQIKDISALKGLTKLQDLDLQYNQLTDIGPLVANPGIGNSNDYIKLQHNCLFNSQAQADITTIEARNTGFLNIYATPQRFNPGNCPN